jgi:hypothetical protein
MPSQFAKAFGDALRASPRVMYLDFAFTNLQKKLKMCYPMVLHLDFAICITWHLEV